MLGAEEGRAPFGAWCQTGDPSPPAWALGAVVTHPPCPRRCSARSLPAPGGRNLAAGGALLLAARGQVGEPALLLCTFLWGWMMAKV